ncbi:-dimethylguanosine trna methyltransferase [Phaffia rhodozyma]|uniref:tRNA (guanine(26)-N(2))-dimethyltransferase n=1 Tax=Phaffia rhodozyma TaxID=264483 RepID=A0A0F7SSZ5_PHARH|nr:-dimethylguanosine trna methyltransferase [Phaffia rhodozyma]
MSDDTSPAQPVLPPPEIIPAKPVPAGLTPYTEQSTTILLPDDNSAFLNPVQQFNRDLSIACISTWGKIWKEEVRAELEAKGKGKGKKRGKPAAAAAIEVEAGTETSETPVATTTTATVEEPSKRQHNDREFVILEALSATGLRAIRYAKEIPGVKYVIANDFSPTAVEAMKRNVSYNDLDPSDKGPTPGTQTEIEAKEKNNWKGKVRVNEGDAIALMYNHRKSKVDCVDLDPYGTAAPFLDGAIQATADGGLLCVTCTDMAVTAGSNYPEKCFANYGGVSAKAVYSHEIAVRLLLNTCSGIAARYGRYIVPQLSLSIDFYMRVFFRVYSSPFEVKRVFSKTGTVYVCAGCQAYTIQPFGRVVETDKGRGMNYAFKNHQGPPTGPRCSECGAVHHLAGPLWIGPIHDKTFCQKVLDHVYANEDKFGTVARMKGMVTMAKEELETPFYLDPAYLSGMFHCTSPSTSDIGSAILHAGYDVSRTHASSGALKTNAPMSFILDLYRVFIKEKAPVKMENIKPNSPAAKLLAIEPTATINFTRHPDLTKHISQARLVRFQSNPRPNWGPAGKARNSKVEEGEARGDKNQKRKAEVEIKNRELKQARKEFHQAARAKGLAIQSAERAKSGSPSVEIPSGSASASGSDAVVAEVEAEQVSEEDAMNG